MSAHDQGVSDFCTLYILSPRTSTRCSETGFGFGLLHTIYPLTSYEHPRALDAGVHPTAGFDARRRRAEGVVAAAAVGVVDLHRRAVDVRRNLQYNVLVSSTT